MQPNLISAEAFCRHHQIEPSFLIALQEHGLAELTVVHNEQYIDESYLSAIEKWRHLHYELHINMEGLHAMNHLLNRVQSLQAETNKLRNRLRRFEQDLPAEDGQPL